MLDTENWKPTDKIIDTRKAAKAFKVTEKIMGYVALTDRVLHGLAPHVTYYRERDYPFINGYRVDFWTGPKPAWDPCVSWGQHELSRMGDVAEYFFICQLVRWRFFSIFSWRELEHSNATPPDESPVATWGDVVDLVEAKLLRALPARKLLWDRAGTCL